MKSLCLIIPLLLSGVAAYGAACGSMARNPRTGLFDCVGSGGGSGTINTGTGLAFYPSSGTTLSGTAGDLGFTSATHTLLGGASLVVDLTASAVSLASTAGGGTGFMRNDTAFTMVSGTTGTFNPSASLPGLVVPSGIVSGVTAGSIETDPNGHLAGADGANTVSYLFFTGTPGAIATPPTSGRLMTWGTNFAALDYGGTVWSAANGGTGLSNLGTGVATFLGTPTGANFNAMVTSKAIAQNSKSTAYTTVLTDCGGSIYHPGADTTARTWTIDSNANVAAPIGCTVTFVNDTSGGVITIAITSDTLVLAGAGSTGSRTLAASGIATATKVTSTRWIINGTGLT